MMAARPRERARRDWPAGLRERRPGYFTWVNPDTGKEMTIGRVTLAQARHQALEALDFLTAKKPTLLERITGASNTVSELLAKMPVSEVYNTAKSLRSLDKKIEANLGALPCSALTTAHCAGLIEGEIDAGRDRSAQALRSRLIAVCNRGQQLGWMDHNPAEPTQKAEVVTQRQRLTLEQFQAVLAKAPEVAPWLPGAMLVALVTGMDRDTLSKLERKAIGPEYLTVMRGKTNVWIEIPLHMRLDAIGMTVADALAACRSNVVSRYVVHHRKTYRKEVPAGAAVQVNRFSKDFKEARELAGITGEDAPTFHEIRSLAKRLYLAQGNVDTKALLGHKTEKMGDLYANPRGAEPMRVKVS